MDIVAQTAPASRLALVTERWQLAHRACVHHLTSCLECAMELCPAGQALWDDANDAEAQLPWWRA